MFLLGLLTGVIISILILTIEIYLKVRNTGFTKVERYIDQQVRPKGEILLPKKEPVIDQIIKIIEKNGN